MRKALTLLIAIFTFSIASQAQTGWNYISGHISPMNDVRTDTLTLRSSQAIFLNQTAAPLFGHITVDCSPGDLHFVRFTSSAPLDAGLTGETTIHLRFGKDRSSGLFNVPVERDGLSILLPSDHDATVIELASHDTLWIHVQTRNTPDIFLQFPIAGLRTIAESHNCPINAP